MKVNLLIIDPQVDFCDPSGSLYVPGAEDDMKRLATMVDRLKTKLYDIQITLDQHNQFDIAHPLYWRKSDGNMADPFTIVSQESMEKGELTPAIPGLYQKTLAYVKELAVNGKYALMIWPPHCLIGTEGSTVTPVLMKSLLDWEKANIAMVGKVSKGSNYTTEHYGAVKAEVPDPNDPSTDLNIDFISGLQEYDEIVIAGEASSHCVAETMKQVADNIGSEHLKKFVILTDAMSAVPGFEQNAQDFIDSMVALGMRTSTTVDYLK